MADFKQKVFDVLSSLGIESSSVPAVYSELVYEVKKRKMDITAEFIYTILCKFTDKDKDSIIREYINSVDSDAELFIIDRFKYYLIATSTITTC